MKSTKSTSTRYESNARSNTKGRIESSAGFRSLFSRTRPSSNNTLSVRRGDLSKLESLRPQPDRTAEMGTYSSSKTSRSRASTTSSASLKSTSRRSRPGTRRLASWDPPPLFQAYSQAIGHAFLSVPSLSTEKILLRGHKRRQSNGEELMKGAQTEDEAAAFSDQSKTKTQLNHRRSWSVGVSLGGWSRKLFVLVTSGYLLQYAAEGHHDRLPEKMLQLGANSVAFASDVIPGKHWVLQIAQAAGDGADSQSQAAERRWSRFSLHNSDARRLAKHLLLVFNDPDEFGIWMNTIRQEIEALGGSHYRQRFSPTEISPPSSEPDVADEADHSSKSSPEPIPKIAVSDRNNRNISKPRRKSFEFSKANIGTRGGLATPTLSLTSSSASTVTDLDAIRNPSGANASVLGVVSNPKDAQVSDSQQPAPLVQTSPAHLQREPEPTDTTLSKTAAVPPSSLPGQGHPGSSPGFSKCNTSTESIASGSGSELNPNLNNGQTADSSTASLSKPRRPMPSALPKLGRTPKRHSSNGYLDESPHRQQPLNVLQDKNKTSAPPRPVSAHARTSAAPGAYLLFPKQYLSTESSASRFCPPSPPPKCALPALPPLGDGDNRDPGRAEIPSIGVRRSKSLRRPAQLQIQLDKLHNCSSIPERSPSVTDAHFATNFGIESPTASARQGGGQTPKDRAAAAPPSTTGPATTQPRSEGRLFSRRSAPMLSSTGKAAPPPSGPPPQGPLPAVPALKEAKRTVKSMDILDYHAQFISRRALIGHCKTDSMLKTCWSSNNSGRP